MTADETPELAADELAAVSQEPGRSDEPARETCQDSACDREDLGEHHAPHPPREIPDSRHSFVPGLVPDVCAECSWQRYDPSQHPQPAREIPADELAEAEGWWAYWETVGSLADDGVAEERAAARTLHAEYDERGRERDAAEAEVERARDVRRQIWQAFGRPDGVGLDVELIDAVADAVQSGRAARAELERLRARVAELERANEADR